MDEADNPVPPKKIKLTEPQDPITKVHQDLHDLMFQHFKDNDVLACSLVSPTWFRATEQSQKCMEKLHLKIVVPYSEENDEKYKNISGCLTSQRCYQNIYIHNFQRIMGDILKILERGSWKTVFISTKIPTIKDFYAILDIIEPTVEKISLSLTSIGDHSGKPAKKIYKFPNLVNLDLTRCYGMMMEEIAEACTSLKILRVDFDHDTWRKNQNHLTKILANSENLERLTLWRCSAALAFQHENIQSYKFKLKHFSFKNSKDGGPSEEEENCLFDFLESQADSVEGLRLEEWFGIAVFKLIFKMTKLKEFTIDMYDAENTIDWEELNLNQSSSIQKFHIDSYRNNRTKIKMFNVMFEAMPSLKFLTMDYLDNDSLRSIGPRCAVLEELEIQELKAAQVDDPLFFPNLKRFHCEDRISMKVKQRINMKPVEQRSTFEQLILTAKPYFVTK